MITCDKCKSDASLFHKEYSIAGKDYIFCHICTYVLQSFPKPWENIIEYLMQPDEKRHPIEKSMMEARRKRAFVEAMSFVHSRSLDSLLEKIEKFPCKAALHEEKNDNDTR